MYKLRNKKIIFLIDNLGSGGAQKQLFILAKLLKKRDFEIDVVCYHDYGKDFYSTQLGELGINVKHFSLSKYIDRIVTIKRLIRKSEGATVVSYLYGANLLACIIKMLSLNRFTLIVSDRTGVVSKPTLKDKLRYQLYRQANVVLCNSTHTEDILSERAKWLRPKLKTIWNIVIDFPKHINNEVSNNKRITFISGASFHGYKNHINLIKGLSFAVDNLGVNKDRVLLNCYGNKMLPDNQVHIDAINALIKDKKLEATVNLYDETTSIGEEIELSDFGVLASLFEGCPNFVIDAMKYAKPVLVSDVCANSFILDENGGYLFNPHNVESIGLAIQKAVDSSIDLRREQGINNRKRAELLFSAESNLLQFENLLLEI